MKSIWTAGFLAFALMISCNKHKQDVPASYTATVNFVSKQPIAISLKALINNPYTTKFEVTNGPTNGKAEIIKDNFMIYTPGNSGNESTALRLLNSDGKEVGTAQITFEESQNSCGIIPIINAEIAQDSTLRLRLVDDATLCTKVNGVFVAFASDSSSSDGFSMTAYGNGLVDLIYTPPAGFLGTSKSLGVIGVNLKQEYWVSFKHSSFDEIVNNSYMFDYFFVSIVEIAVKRKS